MSFCSLLKKTYHLQNKRIKKIKCFRTVFWHSIILTLTTKRFPPQTHRDNYYVTPLIYIILLPILPLGISLVCLSKGNFPKTGFNPFLLVLTAFKKEPYHFDSAYTRGFPLYVCQKGISLKPWACPNLPKIALCLFRSVRLQGAARCLRKKWFDSNTTYTTTLITMSEFNKTTIVNLNE